MKTLSILLAALLFGAPADAPSDPAPSAGDLLYGRVHTLDDGTYEGRIRFGGDEEAAWADLFNAVRDDNPWTSYLTEEQLQEDRTLEIFGFRVATWKADVNLGRPFAVRFGDIASIETRRRRFWVTLKSGREVVLDRYEADDLADGVRVWDPQRGTVDIGEWDIRKIEFLQAPDANGSQSPARLHGTVKTENGSFTGFLQWNREQGLLTDAVRGREGGRYSELPFEAIRSIAPAGEKSAHLVLHDGTEVTLNDIPETAGRHRGIYVDDARFGRVSVAWEAVIGVDLTPGGPGPTYQDFPAGSNLSGSVTTASGDVLSGRLVFDLDEAETIESLDAPTGVIDYLIPFYLVSEIRPSADPYSGVTVRLRSGESLVLERAGDLDDRNGGILVFGAGAAPTYVPWAEVRGVQL